MDTPNSKLAVRMDWRFFTHPHVLCQTQEESWGWGGRLVGLSLSPPFGIYSTVSAFTYCITWCQNCTNGFWLWPLLTISQTLLCGRLADNPIFICGKCRCLPNEATAGCFSLMASTVHQLQVGAVQSPHFMTCFFFLFDCHTLPPTQSWHTIPLCHLHKLVKSFSQVSVTCSGKCCCCFRHSLGAHELSSPLTWKVTVSHLRVTNAQWYHLFEWVCFFSLTQIFEPLFTLRITLENLSSYSVFLFMLWLLSVWERETAQISYCALKQDAWFRGRKWSLSLTCYLEFEYIKVLWGYSNT